MKTLDAIAFALMVIGGLNWGLVGIFRFDLVAAIFGTMTVLSRIVYTLVGLAALYDLINYRSVKRRWMAPSVEEPMEHRRAA